MRNLIWGFIGIGLGLVILFGGSVSDSDGRSGAYRMGQRCAQVMGVAFLGLGILYVGGQLWYMRDELGFGATRTRRRRRPPRERDPRPEREPEGLRDPRREVPRRERTERRPAPMRSDSSGIVIPLVIAGVGFALVLFVAVSVGIIWFIGHQSRSGTSAVKGPLAPPPPQPPPGYPQPNRPPADRPAGPKDAKAYAADLQGDHFAASAAIEALIAMGAKAEPEVMPYLNHDNFNVRHRSAQVIEKIGTAASMPELRKVISAGRSVGGSCEKALTTIRQRERLASGEPAPKPPTPSEDAKRAAADLPGLHSAAAAAMKKLIAMGPAAEGAVIPYLDDDDFNARHRAAQVIEKIGTAASLAELQRVIDAKRSVFGACEKAIVAIEEREEAAKKKP